MQENNIMGIYIAVFGRPADPGGLLWFSKETKDGTDFSAIRDITGTPEYQAGFAHSAPEEIIKSLYQNLFNREPEAAGIAYWSERLASGALSIEGIAVNVGMAAQGEDKETFAHKSLAAQMFTDELDTAVEIASYHGKWSENYGREFLSPVGMNYIPTKLDVQIAVAKLTSSETSIVGANQGFLDPLG